MYRSIISLHKNLLYAFILLLPWQTVWIVREVFYATEKWQYGTIGIYISDVTLIAWIILSIYLYREELITYVETKKKIILSALLLSLWGFLSIFWADDKALAFYGALKLSLTLDFFFLLHITPINTRKVGYIFIFSVLCQGIIGLYQFCTQSTFAQKFLGLHFHDVWHGSTAIINTDIERWLRAYGGMPHPNIFGGILLIALLLSLWLYTTEKKSDIFTRTFLLSSIAIVCANIIMTFSRSAWLVAVISICAYAGFFIIKKKNIRQKIIAPLTLITAITVLLISLLPQLFFSRAHDTTASHNSFGDRKIYVTHAQELIAQHPLNGVGIGNYSNAVASQKNHTRPIWYYQPVHNIYLLITAEIGVVGAILFFAFITTILYDFFQETKRLYMKEMTLLLIISMMLIIGLCDHWAWTSHTGFITLFLFLGLLHKKTALCSTKPVAQEA